MRNLIRARWAAVGAAVAVTLGAGGLASVDAARSSGERAVFVAVTPCRLVDTRAASTVGSRARPLGAGETYTLQTRGAQGECDLPADAVAVSLNVTAVGASAPTFLTIFPAGASRPTVSSLNPQPGQPPTPNAVTTKLATNGRFSIYNRQGVVDLIVDVNGYFADHDHDDRYDTRLDVYTGQLVGRYVANSDFTLVGDSFPRPMPSAVPEPVVERVTVPATSANCPGLGEAATVGVLCLYEYNTDNIDLVATSGQADEGNRRYGFALDVFPTTPNQSGYYLASWAYRVPGP